MCSVQPIVETKIRSMPVAIMTWWIPSVRHLDHPFGDAVAMAGPVPQAIIRAGQLGTIAEGAARLILFNALTLNELMCRPRSDRLVIDRFDRSGSSPAGSVPNVRLTPPWMKV